MAEARKRRFTPATAPGPIRHVLNAIVAPRPIAWVSTLAPDGTANLAPHSYTTIFSADPPIVGFISTGRKDTLRNVEELGEFVYNVAGERLGERLNLTAADFPRDISEFGWAGLTPAPSTLVHPPRVAEAEIAIECRVVEIHRVADTENWLILGEGLEFHVAEAVMRDDRIDPAILRPLARLAGNDFSTFGEVRKMPRPTYSGLLQAGAEPMEPYVEAEVEMEG